MMVKVWRLMLVPFLHLNALQERYSHALPWTTLSLSKLLSRVHCFGEMAQINYIHMYLSGNSLYIQCNRQLYTSATSVKKQGFTKTCAMA